MPLAGGLLGVRLFRALMNAQNAECSTVAQATPNGFVAFRSAHCRNRTALRRWCTSRDFAVSLRSSKTESLRSESQSQARTVLVLCMQNTETIIRSYDRKTFAIRLLAAFQEAMEKYNGVSRKNPSVQTRVQTE
ncbi:hypothetical protein DFS34DRAFT_465904 [Phlyctochytrium arcticum]|nr:hypothetical protein DFS34DRAFT_465904 [Phlyctochytrium arcticum]